MSLCGILKQSTAVNVIIGPFVDSTNGNDEEDGLTIAQADVRLSKNAGADAQKNDNTTCAHEGDGFYMCELDATDTNTVGQLTLWVHVAGALAVRHDYQIIEEAVYDIMFAASATGAVPVASIANNAITAAAINADAFTAAKFAADVTTELQNGLATAASITSLDGKIDIIDNFLDTEIQAILDDTNELQTDWANGGRLDLILDARASQTSVDTIDDLLDTEIPALTTAVADLPTNAELATALGTADDAVLAQVALVKAKTDNLPADPADASDIAALIDALPTAAENAAALLDAANGIETSITPRQALRLVLAALTGKLSGAATTTVTIRNTADDKDRIVATVDADGNRSAVTLDVS